MTTLQKCVRCGRDIELNQKMMRITESLQADSETAYAKPWGVMHERCFLRSVRSPKAAMQELKLLTEEAK